MAVVVELVVTVLAFMAALLALARAVADHFVLKRRLSQMEDKAQDVARLLRERGNLANELAHEIKNPITAILCSAEALDYMIGREMDAGHRKCLAYIKEYGENLLHLVGDFIDLSRAESGYLQSHPVRVTIGPAVETIVGLLQSFANKKHVTLNCELDAAALHALADPRHVKQILFNLVHNAIKFTPPQGRVRVWAQRSAALVKISVQDTGCGIPADQLGAIFDPYVHARREREAKEEGLGLGLAICKALAELGQATISVTSQVGVGSLFELSLPLWQESTQPESPAREENEPAAAQPLSGQKFLLVDQDNGARDSMAELIKTWGGMVDQVTLATEALQAISREAYDAVMLDNTADGLYGYELAKLMREDLKSKATTIIVATEDEKEQELARDNGADECLEKPLCGKSLLKSLKQAGRSVMTH